MLEDEVGRTEELEGWQRPYHQLQDQLSRASPANTLPSRSSHAAPASPQLPHGVGCAITARHRCPQDSAYFRSAELLSLV